MIKNLIQNFKKAARGREVNMDLMDYTPAHSSIFLIEMATYDLNI